MSSKQTLTAQQPSVPSSEGTAKSALFVQLFEADKNRLYAYIYAYVMDYSAADDIFQETSMTLWREFHQFEVGTNFSIWANGIAFNRVRVFRRSHKKYTLGLDDDFLQAFSEVSTTAEKEYEQKPERWWHLQDCSTQLSAPLQKIYNAFYLDDQKAQHIAENTGRSIYAIRKAIHKLRKYLFDCLDNKLRGDAK